MGVNQVDWAKAESVVDTGRTHGHVCHRLEWPVSHVEEPVRLFI